MRRQLCSRGSTGDKHSVVVFGTVLALVGGCGPVDRTDQNAVGEQQGPLLARDLPLYDGPIYRPELYPRPRPLYPPYRLLVLTPEALETPSLILAAHKQTTGMPTLVKTVEQIDDDPLFAAGRDLAERLKLAIKELERRHGIEYVLLMGDADQFPVRWVWLNDFALYGRRYQPSDLYFSDLYDPVDANAINDLDDGAFDSWDANGDGRFGEVYVPVGFSNSWTQLNRDRIDLQPDVAVGRVPASTVEEALTMVQKIVHYEQTAGDAWSERLLLVTGNWGDPSGVADTVADEMSEAGFDPTKYYFDPADPDWDSASAQLRRAYVLRALFGYGYGFVSYMGHGGPHEWSSVYPESNIALVDNADRLPIVFASACATARFHVDDGRYKQLDGQLYTICNNNVIDGDATFELMIDADTPALVQFATVNLSPRERLQRTAEGLRIATGAGDQFVRSAPQVDPRAYWRSLRSANYPDRYLRHRNFVAELSPVASGLDREDSTFRPVAGLSRNGPAGEERISLESWNFPGWYLVEHEGELLLRQRRICDDDFSERATFRVVAGLANSQASSLESIAAPGRFVRHRNFRLYVEANSGSVFDQDATFWLDEPNHDPRPHYASFVLLGTNDWIVADWTNGQVALQQLATAADLRGATFRLMAGLEGEGNVSFESLLAAGGTRTTRSHPSYYLRHRNHAMEITESRPMRQVEQPEPAAIQSPTIGGQSVEVDSMAEAFLVQQQGGAIAYIGAFTGAQWASMRLNRIFFSEVAAQGTSAVLGDVWSAALRRFIADELGFEWGGWGPGATYDHLHKMMLYGDPSLRVGGID